MSMPNSNYGGVDMDVNEKISIQDYQAKWPIDFESEKKNILTSLQNYKFHIEHIGSTSVIGMCAKPIIDILIGVENFPPSDDFIQKIIDVGYEYLKEACVADRLYFVKRTSVSFNLHIVKYGKEI